MPIVEKMDKNAFKRQNQKIDFFDEKLNKIKYNYRAFNFLS